MTLSAKKISDLAFEEALGELEKLIARLEGGDVPLRELVHQYQHGSQLLEFCQKELGQAQQVISQLRVNDPTKKETP